MQSTDIETEQAAIHDKLFETLDAQGGRGAFFEDLFRNSTAITVVSDRHGTIIIANGRAVATFLGEGAGETAAAGRNVLEFVCEDDRAGAIEIWNESLAGKKELNCPLRMKGADGGVLYLLITGRPILKGGEAVSFQLQALDMIDQKVRERNLLHTAGIETAGQLAGSFAHDFNNLLTVINGYSEIMLNSIDREHPFYGKIYQICQAGFQASQLTQKVLEFSRKTLPVMQPVDVNRELDNQEAILRRIVGGGVRISIVKKDGLGRVMIDPAQLAKMLLDLAVNARDAMPAGGTVTISTDSEVVDESGAVGYGGIAPGRCLVLSVSDTGTGMSEEVKEKIFDPFFSARESGRGIGLWAAGRAVKQAGGAMCVESAPGVGTTLRILLPFCREEVPLETVDAPEAGQAAPSPDGRTILVVEDDDIVRDLVSEILKGKGHRVLTARNGGDALQLARQYEGTIDLLITDMVMRRIDGIMLSKKMLSILPRIKVMLMSGYGSDVVKGEELKGIAFLQKPFLPGELVEKVGTIFGGAGLQRAEQ